MEKFIGAYFHDSDCSDFASCTEIYIILLHESGCDMGKYFNEKGNLFSVV